MTYEAMIELHKEGSGWWGQCPACECGNIEMKPLVEPTGWELTCTVCPQLYGIALIEGRMMFASLEIGVTI